MIVSILGVLLLSNQLLTNHKHPIKNPSKHQQEEQEGEVPPVPCWLLVLPVATATTQRLLHRPALLLLRYCESSGVPVVYRINHCLIATVTRVCDRSKDFWWSPSPHRKEEAPAGGVAATAPCARDLFGRFPPPRAVPRAVHTKRDDGGKLP